MKEYHCKICKRQHKVLYKASYPIPEQILALIEDNDPRIVELEGTYILDKSEIISRGRLLLGVEESDSIELELWVKFDGKQMYKNKDAVDRSEPIFVPGTIINELHPFYLKTQGAQIEVLFSEWSYDEEFVEFIAINHEELMQDQKTPLGEHRLLEMMERLYHPEFHENEELNRSVS